MINAIRAEARKAVSTAMPWGFVALGLGLTALNVFLSNSGTNVPLTDRDYQHALATAGATAGTFALLLGIVGMTAEDRHKTMTPSLLACPRRGTLVAAKTVVHAAIGVLMTAAASALCWAMMSMSLSSRDADFVLTGGDLATIGLGGVVYGALAGAFGVGLGAILRNQVAAVIVAVMWFFLFEALVMNMANGAGRWLPGGAAAALAGPGALGAGGSTGMTLLSATAGGLLLAGYATVAATIGARGLLRRDIS